MLKQLLVNFLLLSTFAHAETLFYKKNGSMITPQEHEILYKIMLETQFPMSVEYGSYYDDEIKAMNEKIQKQLPNSGIEATFIPTTLYELLVLKFIQENISNIDHATSGILKLPERYKLHPYRFMRSDKGIFYDSAIVTDINIDTNIIKWHLNINNFIVSLLKKYNFFFPLTFKIALESVKTLNLLKAVNDLRPSHSERNRAIAKEFDSKVGRAIAIEYQAYNTGKFILYRGSEYVDDFFDPKLSLVQNRSISFGASLFSGFLFDSGACAYCYIARNYYGFSNLGYVVFIGKKAYFDEKLKNIFYIPPIVTLASLIGSGEHFHPRTKVISEEGGIAGLKIGVNELATMFPHYQIKAATKQEAEKVHNEMLQYIKDHHLVFKDQPKARL